MLQCHESSSSHLKTGSVCRLQNEKFLDEVLAVGRHVVRNAVFAVQHAISQLLQTDHHRAHVCQHTHSFRLITLLIWNYSLHVGLITKEERSRTNEPLLASLTYLQAGCPSDHQINSVKVGLWRQLKAFTPATENHPTDLMVSWSKSRIPRGKGAILYASSPKPLHNRRLNDKFNT